MKLLFFVVVLAAFAGAFASVARRAERMACDCPCDKIAEQNEEILALLRERLPERPGATEQAAVS